MDLLIVGIGNYGEKFVGTRHNVGFTLVEELYSYYYAICVNDGGSNGSDKNDMQLGRPNILDAASIFTDHARFFSKFHSEITVLNDIRLSNLFSRQYKKIIFVKPHTYVNETGTAVLSLINFYKIALENVLVLHDDLNLALGRVKAKIGGGDGGHNGIKSIDKCIGKAYKRLRFGIDRPGPENIVASSVVEGGGDGGIDERSKIGRLEHRNYEKIWQQQSISKYVLGKFTLKELEIIRKRCEEIKRHFYLFVDSRFDFFIERLTQKKRS